MNEQPNIKQIWQEASKKAEDNNRLTQASIVKSIEAKSKDVISQFVKEKKTGLISGIIIIPLMVIGLFINFPFNVYSFTIALILFISASMATYEGWKQLSRIKKLDESGSLQESLSGKLSLLSKNFKKSQIFSPIIGIVIFLPITLLYRYLEYGNLQMTQQTYLTLGSSLIFIISLILLMLNFQKYKYLKPLKECLDELEQMEPPAPNRRSRINTGLLVTVLLIVSLILYLIAKVN
ncbi:MAG: hypothetical protein KAH17_08835 [Bacteroidales bacterium]|nr:hypothetical protein [Bacteroidales bacterium]